MGLTVQYTFAPGIRVTYSSTTINSLTFVRTYI